MLYSLCVPLYLELPQLSAWVLFAFLRSSMYADRAPATLGDDAGLDNFQYLLSGEYFVGSRGEDLPLYYSAIVTPQKGV